MRRDRNERGMKAFARQTVAYAPANLSLAMWMMDLLVLGQSKIKSII